MMPMIKVWCLPNNLTEEKLREVHQEIVRAAVSVKELGLKDEGDILTLFPKDMMNYGLGTEIAIEVAELWEMPERTDEVRATLAKQLGEAVSRHFPTAKVMCYITPFGQQQGFWMKGW